MIVPVQIGGTTRYALHLAFTRPGPAWLAQYVPRLQVLAKVLVTALERSRSIVAHQESEARLDLAAGLAGAGMWDLELNTNIFWATARAREIYGIGQDEQIILERLFNTAHPDDVGALRRELEEALQANTPLQIEHRIVIPGGEVRWVAVRGARSPESFGGGNHFLGISIDVTERKDLEEIAKRSLEEIKRLNELLEVETRYLRKEIGLSHSHKEIIGKSNAIRAVSTGGAGCPDRLHGPDHG